MKQERIGTFKTPVEHLEASLQAIDSANSNIIIASWVFTNGDIPRQYSQRLIKRAGEIKIDVTVDEVSKTALDENGEKYAGLLNSIMSPAKNNDGYQSQTEVMLQEMVNAGVNLRFVNKLNPLRRLIPWIGSSHIKIFGQDNAVGSLGGINLYTAGFSNIDYMTWFREPNMVEAIYEAFDKLKMGQLNDDYAVECRDDLKLLVDGGKINSSKYYYSTVIDMVEDAKSDFIFVSQLLPDGKLLKAMEYKSKTGTEITILHQALGNRVYTEFPWGFLTKRSLDIISPLYSF